MPFVANQSKIGFETTEKTAESFQLPQFQLFRISIILFHFDWFLVEQFIEMLWHFHAISRGLFSVFFFQFLSNYDILSKRNELGCLNVCITVHTLSHYGTIFDRELDGGIRVEGKA